MKEYWTINIYKNFVIVQCLVVTGTYQEALEVAMRVSTTLNGTYEISHTFG